MANKFWVGGGSNNNWNSSPTTNWANSSGGTGNQTAPGTGDVAVFDSNSGTGNSVISANITVQGLECDGSTAGTGAYAGTLTINLNTTLSINTGAANSVRLSSSMTYTPVQANSIIALIHTTGTANIKTYGKALAGLTINGAGGTTQILDNLSCNAIAGSILTITAGIFDANGGAGGPFTITAHGINSSNSNVRSLILGGLVKLGGNMPSGNNLWAVSTAGTFTFTKNSANIEILPCAAGTGNFSFAGAGLTYNDLTLDATSTVGQFLLTGANTFAHLSVGAGWNLSFPGNATTTISNAFAFAGTQILPMLLTSSSTTLNATVSCPSGGCTLNWGALWGVIGTGGATFTATNTNNFGTLTNVTSGWSVTPPADATLVLTAPEITTLGRMIDSVCCATASTGSSTTSVTTSALTFNGAAATGVVSNQFAGRVVEFSSVTTTAGLRGATSVISASTASNTPTLTVAALPATPASGDIFCII